MHRGRYQGVLGTGVTALGFLLLLIVSVFTYRYHNEASSTLTRNGVGEESQEGLSPLDFHSALGSSNQPAALLRFEGDYTENPFSPMLYLRESALSTLDSQKNEFIIAGRGFDRDVNFTGPNEGFEGKGDGETIKRVPVTQSIYLLTDHKLAFALDYPLSIVRLTTPKNSTRFKGAYRAYSMAPAYTKQDLEGADVGDPRWTDEVRAHYLETHPDKRYGELAAEITQSETRLIPKAYQILSYLSTNAIYTLSPNHEVQDGEDPTAAFLFGDKRGYCVHFAHAMTYLFRSLGIPARIGTGYLTDLSQSRDGHVLLRMSDRHAWSEIYVQNFGWVPFDIQPERVESHAETPVDQKLLEELMGLLDPGEEILPKDVLANEPGLQDFDGTLLPDITRLLLKFLGVVVFAFGAIIIGRKFYLHWGWLLPFGANWKLRKGYVALVSRLYDLGIERHPGETRLEFRTRVAKQISQDMLGLSAPLVAETYGFRAASRVSEIEISNQIRQDLSCYHQLSKWKRFFGLINPSSTICALWGYRW